MATLRSIISDWEFDVTDAKGMVSSDSSKITLDRDAGLITLVVQPDTGEYSKDTDLTITTDVKTVPMNVEWSKVQMDHDTPKSLDLTQSTSVRLRLSNGSNEYYWNGAAWTVAAATNWNTLAEVQANLTSWTGPKLGWVINLVTTDGNRRPTVSRIRVLSKVDQLSQFNDLVFDTVIGGIQDNVRPIAIMAVESDGTDTISLGDYDLGSSYVITAVDSVYNDTDDPTHQTDLLSSYNTTSKVVTLSSAQDSDDVLTVNYKYAPPVSYRASQDYSEIASVPSLVFDSIEFEDLGEAATGDYIMDTSLTPPQAVILPAPRRTNVTFTLDAFAPLVSDLYLLQESVLEYLQSNRVISSSATGKNHTLQITDQFQFASGDLDKDLNQSRMSFQLQNVYLSLRPAKDPDATAGTGFGIDKLTITSDIGQSTSTLSIQED